MKHRLKVVRVCDVILISELMAGCDAVLRAAVLGACDEIDATTAKGEVSDIVSPATANSESFHSNRQ